MRQVFSRTLPSILLSSIFRRRRCQPSKMYKILGITALCLTSCCVRPAQSIFCWVNVNSDLNERQPLLLQPNLNEFFYPAKSTSKDLKLNFCESVRVACPNNETLTVFGSNLDTTEATLRCYGFTFFDVVGTRYAAPFKRIRCLSTPSAEAGNATSGASCPNGTIAQVGFQLQQSSTINLPTIDQICYDESLGRTYWAHHRVTLAVRKRQRETGLPAYRVGPFYTGIAMGPSIFTRDSQRMRLQGLLGDASLVNALVPAGGSNHLVEGMLVPRSDMFYRSQQDSTFFYINSVPMWKSIRDGNWKLVEAIVRKTAGKDKQPANLDVWTGGYGLLAYQNSDGNATEISLTTNSDGESAVPVPRFLFKYVVDRVRNRGIVFVTLNDPYATSVTSEEMLCAARSSCSSLYPQFKLVQQGYTYCCAIDYSSEFVTIAAELGLPLFPTAQPLI